MFPATENFPGMFERFGNRNVNTTLFTTDHMLHFATPLNVRTWRRRGWILKRIFAMPEILANDENAGTPPQFGNNGSNDQNKKQ